MDHDKKLLTELARENRRNATAAEAVMWRLIRGRRFLNLKFRRQHEIGRYIVDFYCDELKLAIELDGAPHFDPMSSEADARRSAFLHARGVTVTRIENEELLYAGDCVRQRLERLVMALRRVG